jgi:hypothetical protein
MVNKHLLAPAPEVARQAKALMARISSEASKDMSSKWYGSEELLLALLRANKMAHYTISAVSLLYSTACLCTAMTMTLPTTLSQVLTILLSHAGLPETPLVQGVRVAPRAAEKAWIDRGGKDHPR